MAALGWCLAVFNVATTSILSLYTHISLLRRHTMEAIAALGLACNVVQLVQTGWETASIFKQAYENGTTTRNSDLRTTTQSLSTCLDGFKTIRLSQLPDDEKELVRLGRDVATIAQSLHDMVKDFVSDQPVNTLRKLKNGWKSIRLVDAVKEKEAKLRLYQDALNTTTLVDLRQRYDLSQVQNRDFFDQLSTDLQDFLKNQASIQSEEHQRTRAVVQQEGANIRADLAAKFDALTIKNEEQVALQQLISSLRFPDMNRRRNDISCSCAGSFEWIMECQNSMDFQAGDEASSDHRVGRYQRGKYDNSDSFRSHGSNDFRADRDKDDPYEGFWNSELRCMETKPVKMSDFVEWLKTGQENYWICGKAGSGKSTLMRFIAKHKSLSAYLKQWAGGEEIAAIDVYIWNAGSHLQKSHKGVLATILVQLLEGADTSTDTVQSLIHNQYHRKRLSISDWHTSELEDLITAVIQGRDCHYCFLVDGLDELEIQQRSEDDEILLRFIRRISQLPRVKCCLSSRPEQLFEASFQQIQRLRLEELNANDITKLCVTNLRQCIRDTRRRPNDDDTAALKILMAELIRGASGVFLWAHLVLRQICRGIRAYEDMVDLQRYVTALPLEISKLYANMWAKNNEDLLENRQEAANFINLALAFPAEDYSSLSKLNIVQFALFFDRSLHSKLLGPRRLEDLSKAVTKFKTLISVRSAGLLHVSSGTERAEEDPVPEEHRYVVLFKDLRWSKVEFIHRTAKDFVCHELTGQEIRSHMSLTPKTMYKRVFHTLLLEHSVSAQALSFLWLKDFTELLCMHCDSLSQWETTGILEELEKVCRESVRRYTPFKHPVDDCQLFILLQRGSSRHPFGMTMLPLDFNSWTFAYGLSSRLLSLIENNSNHLNPEYCAYLLCSFERVYVDIDVDQGFYNLLSILVRSLRPTVTGKMYMLCNSGNDESLETVIRDIAVTRTIGEGLLNVMYESYRTWGQPKHDQSLLPLLEVYTSLPCLSKKALSVLKIHGQAGDTHLYFKVSSLDQDIRNVNRYSSNVGCEFLIEYDLGEMFHWYGLTRSKRAPRQQDKYVFKPLLANHRWSIVVKAIKYKIRHTESSSTWNWCTPSVSDCDAVSTILSRLPIPPCPTSYWWETPEVNQNSQFGRDLLAFTLEVCVRSPLRGLRDILFDLEHIVSANDPRVLTKAPPMFLDALLSEHDSNAGEVDEEDDFFDAVE